MTAPLRFAYCSNGLRDHDLDGALELVAAHGYGGIALTLDHGHLDPFDPDLARQLTRLRRRLDDLGLAVAVETGARFLLDPHRKHHPTLLDDDGRRLDLLRRAVALAPDLGAEVVHLWSGAPTPGADLATARERLAAACRTLLADAESTGVVLGFEPEPGMMVETIADWEALLAAVDHHPRFGITLDLGHCLVTEVASVPRCVARVAPRLVHVQIEDMRRGVHRHLAFGEGDLEVPAALAALHASGFGGLVAVELSRHSHTAHITVPRSIEFLRRAEREATIVGVPA